VRSQASTGFAGLSDPTGAAEVTGNSEVLRIAKKR
jgi:hypothetical protein